MMEIRKLDTEAMKIIDGADSAQISRLISKIQKLRMRFLSKIPDYTHEERRMLDESLILTYAKFGITQDNDSLISEDNPNNYKKMPIISDLYTQLHKYGQKSQRLCDMLAEYVSGSAKAFNAQTNVDLDNKYVVIDVSGIGKETLTDVMSVAVECVMDKCKEDRTVKKVIIIDEIWTLIGDMASEEAAELVLEIFKTIRAYGGSAIAATQDLNDFFARDNGKYGKGIINNSKIKWIMQLEQGEAVSVQNELDLSASEIQEVTHFQRGEGLLIANQNHIPIKFRASHTEDELVTTDPEQLRKIFERKKVKKIN